MTIKRTKKPKQKTRSESLYTWDYMIIQSDVEFLQSASDLALCRKEHLFLFTTQVNHKKKLPSQEKAAFLYLFPVLREKLL